MCVVQRLVSVVKLKTFGFAAVVLVGVGLIIALIVPSLVEEAVEAELQARLASMGVDAEWDSFSSRFGRSFQITNMKLEMPSRGVSVDAKSLVVSVSLVSVFEQTISIEGVELEGAQLHVDLKQLKDSQQTSGDSSDGHKSSSTAFRESLGRFIESPPDVLVRESSISVSRGDVQLAVASTSESTLSLGWSEVKMHGDLHLEALDPAVSRWLRPTDAVLDAVWTTKTGAISASLTSPETDRPLISWEDPDLGALRIAQVDVVADVLKKEANVSVDLLSVRIGDDDVPALSLEAPTLDLFYRRGRPAVVSKGAKLVVAPSKRGDIVRLLRPELRPVEVSSSPTKTSKPWSQQLNRIQRLLGDTEFTFNDLRVDLQIEDNDEEWTRLTLVESLSGSAKAGHLGAAGSTAGGTFGIEADLLPGDLLPRYLSIDIQDVDLDTIPGMPKGRSELPSRGTSGRVGGVFSANLLFQAPLKGFLSPIYEYADGELSVHWTQGVVDLVGLSDEPLTGIEFSTKATFRLNPQMDHLEVVSGHLDWGAIDVEYRGYLEDMSMDSTMFVRAEMSEIECQRAFRSLPAGMLGPYRNIEFEGKWAPSVEFFLPVWRPRALRLEFDGFEDLCVPTDMNVPKSMRPEFVEVRASAPTGPHRFAGADGFTGPILSDVFWLNRPFVKRVIEGVSSEEVEVSVGPGLPTYVPLEAMPPWVGGAAYLSEEILFYTGDGISLGLIKKALRLNLEKGRFVYGGSTVTQQLVKNLFLTRDKTLSRKLQEALISWRITDQISKDRVLELYLNCIEFGPDIYGIGPAAQYYFQKNARDLSPLEAVFLAMLKPNPLYGARVIQRRKTPEGGWWSNRMDEMFQRLLDHGLIRPEDVEGQKPYVLEWDGQGRYIDRRKKNLVPLLPL